MDYRKAYGLPERYFLSLGRMVEKKNLATLVSAYARYAEGVAVAGERLKVKGNDGEKQGDMPDVAASPPQAKDSEVVTSHQSLATRYSLPALVFVGSGELENALKEQARSLGLRVIDRTEWKAGQISHGLTRINTEGSERLAADRTGQEASCRVTPAVGKGPQSETDDCKLTPDDSAAQRAAVYFYGFRQIEENPVFYALAEAFVLPSLKEEWGLVVNEAMAAGLPVIVSRTAGCAEDLVPASEQVASGEWRVAGKDSDDCQLKTENSLEQRSNGFVFEPKSSDALCEALRRIADPLNPQLSTLNAAAMGCRSREIVAKFSCENFARQALSAARAAEQV
jgi:glycosyltransferase involved in cell wall biosynthesis